MTEVTKDVQGFGNVWTTAKKLAQELMVEVENNELLQNSRLLSRELVRDSSISDLNYKYPESISFHGIILLADRRTLLLIAVTSCLLMIFELRYTEYG